jgi:hypothetical protein
MEDQKWQVKVWQPVIIMRWGHNSSETIEDSHPDLDDRFVPIQKEFWGWHGSSRRITPGPYDRGSEHPKCGKQRRDVTHYTYRIKGFRYVDEVRIAIRNWYFLERAKPLCKSPQRWRRQRRREPRGAPFPLFDEVVNCNMPDSPAHQ